MVNKRDMDEIEKIFAQKPRKPLKEPVSKTVPKKEHDDWIQGMRKESVPRKYTLDGLPIYSEDILSDSPGDTKLCPFKCQCCF